MPSLSETQAAVRTAVVTSDLASAGSLLIGGAEPTRRLEIHRRHYHASLIETLHGRFPGVAWLIGDEAVIGAAAEFVASAPPTVLCMAEFGGLFPAWLGSRPTLSHIPYLAEFAALEWEVGRVSVAISHPSLDVSWLKTQDPATLGEQRLRLQPGAAWITARHNVDELVRAFLAGTAPAQFTLVRSDRWIEVRGTRGDVDVRAIPAGDWHFRHALARGGSIEDAAGVALDADRSWDPGVALVHLLSEGLAVCP